MGYEIDFLPVGDSNGDAICIRYGSQNEGFHIHVVDAGYSDTGQAVVDHINKYYGFPRFIDHVVVSHADADHATGIKTVLENFEVGCLWMNRPWLYAAEIISDFHGNFTVAGLAATIRDAYPILAELEEYAHERGIPVREAFAGHAIGPFRILAPRRDRYLSLIAQFDRTPTSYAAPIKGPLRKLLETAKALLHFIETWADEKLEENPPPVSASNESCVVQLGLIDGRALLLTADAGPIALTEAADVAEYLNIKQQLDVVQVPHHGSRRNVTPSVLDRWLGRVVAEGESRGYAFCSVGANKPEYPRKRVQNAFLRRGYGVISTRTTWKSSRHGIAARPGSVAVHPEPFVGEYDE